ncbi:MAG: D-hexose-6-phosphate mutarotase [Propionivibrio sp.]
MTDNTRSAARPFDAAPLPEGVALTTSAALYPERHAPGEVGLPLLLVENALGRAVIALQGAHAIAFRPAGRREMLWLSPKCKLQPGTAIRGGIPLCLPWFGPGPDGKSAHGFVRTAVWTLSNAEIAESGETSVTLELAGDASSNALWPHAFVFRLEFVVGGSLTMRLSASNLSREAAPFAFAFHTYFAVPDVAQARVSGLENTDYIDKMDGGSRQRQHDPVTISGATDRIYLDVPAVQVIESADGRIAIESDAGCAVVWNAWDNDRNIADMGAGNHVGYLCVERGEVAERSQTIPPGETYRSWMTLSL